MTVISISILAALAGMVQSAAAEPSCGSTGGDVTFNDCVPGLEKKIYDNADQDLSVKLSSGPDTCTTIACTDKCSVSVCHEEDNISVNYKDIESDYYAIQRGCAGDGAFVAFNGEIPAGESKTGQTVKVFATDGECLEEAAA